MCTWLWSAGSSQTTMSDSLKKYCLAAGDFAQLMNPDLPNQHSPRLITSRPLGIKSERYCMFLDLRHCF